MGRFDRGNARTGTRGRAGGFLLAVFLGLGAAATPAQAVNGTWNVNASGNWSTAANWLGGVPSQPGDGATFGDVITSNRTVTLDAPFTVGGLLFDDNNNYRISGAAALTLSAPGGATVSVNNAAGDGAHTIAAPVVFASPATLNDNSAGLFTLSGALSGTGQLTKLGPGTVSLAGDGLAWSGGLVVSAGTVRMDYAPTVADAGAYRAPGTGPITVQAGATLDLGAAERSGKFTGSLTNDLVLTGTGVGGTAGALRTTRNQGTVLTGNLTLAGGATLRTDIPASGAKYGIVLGDPTTGAGAFGGIGGLTLAGRASVATPAPFQLNVRSTHAGGTTLDAVLLDVSPLGSLVGTGDVTVNDKSQLRVARAAGTDPTLASVSPKSIALKGGSLAVAVDADFATFLSPATTAGSLVLHGVNNFTAGGTNLVDFGALAGGQALRISASENSTVAAGVTLRPDPVTNTLRFGGAGGLDLTVNAILADFGGVPTNVEHAGLGRTILAAANTYTGRTVVRDSSIRLDHPRGLGAGTGADSDGTEVTTNGLLTFASNMTVTGERFRLTGGILSASDNTSVIDSDIAVESAGGRLIGGDYRGVVSGPGDIIIGGTMTLRGSNTFTGAVTFTNGTVDVLSPNGLGSAAAGTEMQSGNLRVMAATAEPIKVHTSGTVTLGAGVAHAEVITLVGGTLASEPGAAFGGTVDVQSGIVAADLTGTGTITKTTSDAASFNGVGAAFDGVIAVKEGKLSFFGPNALGSAAAGTIITGPTQAFLETIGSTNAEPIFLNNAAGGPNGALVGNSSFGAILSGPVSLGNVGSSIGLASNGPLTLTGPISGGTLTVKGVGGNSATTIAGASNTYAGSTVINPGANLSIAGAGALTSTRDVYVAGMLRFDNAGQPGPDRLADNIPLTLARGTIRLDLGTETVGPITLARGGGTINVYSSDGGTLGVLTIGNLTRQKGDGVVFTSRVYYEDRSTSLGKADGFGGKVFFANAPQLSNGMIGGWALVGGNSNRFAGYGPTGVVPLVGDAADINAALSPANVELADGTTAVMTANRTVNSLRLYATTALDLGGRTLTVGTGGVLTASAGGTPRAISNGTIIPGAAADGELFLYGGIVSARIADGPGGPTTLSPNGVHLAGANTYTGPTRVAGQVFIDSPGGLPTGNDLILQDGGVFLNYTSTTPVNLGTVSMLGGTTALSYVAGNAPVNAAAFLIDSGRIEAVLVGSGTLTKRTGGTAVMKNNIPAYSGAVELLAGQLQAEDLGTGPVRIEPGAVLVATRLGFPQFNNPFTLNGGTIRSDTSSQVILANSVTVNADASISRAYVTGPLLVKAAATLTATLGYPLDLLGDLRIDGRLAAADASTINVSPTTGHSVSGTGTITANAVTIGSGAFIEPGGSIGALTIDGNLAFTTGGTLRIDLGPDGASDLLRVLGNVDLSKLGDRLEFVGGVDGERYAFLTYAGSLTGVFDTVPTNYVVNYDAVGRTVYVTVPEPSAAVTVAILTFAATTFRRRRRRPSRHVGAAGAKRYD